MLTLNIPPRRDPVARGALLLLIAGVAWLAIARPGVEPVQAQSEAQAVILIATPTLPVPMPTAQPVVVRAAPTPEEPTPVPTDAPAVAEQAPVVVQEPAQVIYQQPDPIIVTTEPEIIVNTPVVTYQTAVPETHQQLPSGAEIIMTATPAPGDPGFADSFGAPDPEAKCAFVGCL